MKELITIFQKELLQVAGFAESTVDTYSSSIVAFCNFTRNTSNIDPHTVRGRHILAWLQAIKTGISRSRLRQHQFAIKSFFTFLDKRGIIENNPAAALPRIKIKQSTKNKPVSSDIVFQLLDAFDCTTWLGRRNHLIIAMLWCLGLRISELTGLCVEAFEPDHEPENRIGLLRVRGKNKKQRALFVVDTLYDELQGYLQDPESPKEKNQPLFPVSFHKAISSSRIQKLFKEYGKKADIRVTLTPHILRHSFATEMYRLAVPLSSIQAMLGHAHKNETAVYVHVTDEMKEQALAEVTICGGDIWQ